MAVKSWKLIDASEELQVDHWKVDAHDVPGAPETFSIEKRTLSSGLSQDVDIIEINNGEFRFIVVPTRGMSVWKGWVGQTHIGWQSPVRGPVHPKFVQLTEPSGLGWLDGFDELIVRCGLVSNGAPDFDENNRLSYPLHGRVANRPAHLVEVEIDGDEISIKGIVEESRFHFTKLRMFTTMKTRFNELGLRIHDEIENYSAAESEMQMLYHVNFGTPLLEAGAEVSVPIDTIVPRNDWAAAGIGHWSTYSEPVGGTEERVYFFKLLGDTKGNTQALLKNKNESFGASLQFNTQQLKCFSLWKNETSISDGYVTGIEPGTNFPNPRTYESEQDRIVKIKPGAMYAMDLGLTLHDSKESVAAKQSEIDNLQSQKSPTVYDQPQPGWCAS